MNEFEKQFREIEDFLKFEDYPLLTKRLIDLTLDTETISHYQAMNAYLNWLDEHEQDTALQREKLTNLMQTLYEALKDKPLVTKKVLVEANQLEKRYAKNGFGLGPINLQLFSGEIVGLVGENGNGKTTLLRSLSGELEPTKGNIKYHVSYADRYDLRTKLVYIPQRTDTWYGSMFDNLLFTATTYGYSPDENELVVNLIIARLGLRKFRFHSWKSLSSGYKMRFELARMLLRKPNLLLIDEPLANLDILAQQTILEDFRAIAKSPFRPIGVVLSSQQLYEVEKTSDQVVFLKLGQQKNLHESPTDGTNETLPPLVIELECSWGQSELAAAFEKLALENLQFNGGTYIATFTGTVTVSQFLQNVIQHEIPLMYYRNISNSTRRFFVS